jgi:hypothetical protein
MDMGWILTLVSSSNPIAQLSIQHQNATAPVVSQVTVESPTSTPSLPSPAAWRGGRAAADRRAVGRAALLGQGPKRGGAERGQPPWRRHDSLMAKAVLVQRGGSTPKGSETTSITSSTPRPFRAARGSACRRYRS